MDQLTLSLIYLSAQDIASDDHLLINRRWRSYWGFMTSPRAGSKQTEARMAVFGSVISGFGSLNLQ